MAGRHNEVRIDPDALAGARRVMPGVTDTVAVTEIVRRYVYLHEEIKALADAEHLLAFWRRRSAEP